MISRIAFILFLTLCSNLGFSQSYHPFPNDSATWTEVFVTDNQGPPPPWQWCEMNYIFMRGDTIIQNRLYSKLYIGFVIQDSNIISIDTLFYMAVREDSNKKVWKRSSYDKSEVLLFDFGLNLGDTFISSHAGPLPVVGFDSILIDGQYRRVTKLLYHSQLSDTARLIEGIGFESGINGPNTGYDAYTVLKCFEQKERHIYGIAGPYSCDCENCNCKSRGVGIKSISTEKSIKLFPNPTSTVLTVSFQNPSSTLASIEVYSIEGKKVISRQTINEVFNLDVSSFEKGMYLIKIEHSEKSMFKHFIKTTP